MGKRCVLIKCQWVYDENKMVRDENQEDFQLEDDHVINFHAIDKEAASLNGGNIIPMIMRKAQDYVMWQRFGET